ncbi:hypothetical protein BGX38DRAFT_1158371 [Terfezia claveryi]|nr:hypothetical protein BGX38DRAFT_1158371 [Terfezia claveryi]
MAFIPLLHVMFLWSVLMTFASPALPRSFFAMEVKSSSSSSPLFIIDRVHYTQPSLVNEKSPLFIHTKCSLPTA